MNNIFTRFNNDYYFKTFNDLMEESSNETWKRYKLELIISIVVFFILLIFLKTMQVSLGLVGNNIFSAFLVGSAATYIFLLTYIYLYLTYEYYLTESEWLQLYRDDGDYLK